MEALDDLKEVLTENRAVRLADDGIYSILPDTSSKFQYDRRASVYDLVVNTRLYYSVISGSSPFDYDLFAGQAVGSCPDGTLLDAACGSMLFTALQV